MQEFADVTGKTLGGVRSLLRSKNIKSAIRFLSQERAMIFSKTFLMRSEDLAAKAIGVLKAQLDDESLPPHLKITAADKALTHVSKVIDFNAVTDSDSNPFTEIYENQRVDNMTINMINADNVQINKEN